MPVFTVCAPLETETPESGAPFWVTVPRILKNGVARKLTPVALGPRFTVIDGGLKLKPRPDAVTVYDPESRPVMVYDPLGEVVAVCPPAVTVAPLTAPPPA